MCGGYTIAKSVEKLTKRFHAQLLEPGFSPRYNARPSQQLPIILNTDPQHIVMAHWGIKPIWAIKQGLSKEIINTQSASYNKPTFKKGFESRRCLILADGFYEWMKTSSGKQPYRFVLKDDEPFAFAGIYEENRETGKPCFSIITTEPNEVVQPIHDRMPAMLLPSSEAVWLNPDTDLEASLALLKPYPENLLMTYPVSKKVNFAGNEGDFLVRTV